MCDMKSAETWVYRLQKFFLRNWNRCNCWRITLWRRPYRGPKGQGYSETLRQKDRADLYQKRTKRFNCILCVCFWMCSWEHILFWCNRKAIQFPYYIKNFSGQDRSAVQNPADWKVVCCIYFIRSIQIRFGKIPNGKEMISRCFGRIL